MGSNSAPSDRSRRSSPSLELLGVAVAGAVGLAILVYTVQSLVAPPRQEETY